MADHSELPPAVLVTGASGAIGAATVSAFLAAGLHVVGADREAPIPSAAHARLTSLCVDVSDGAALEAALGEVCTTCQLAHLVGVAGGALPEEPAAALDAGGLSPDRFRASIDVNLTTQYVALHTALPWLRRGSGANRSVTFTSSINGLAGWGMPAYSAAKAGLVGMMRALVGPLGAEGIRVNVVAPGTVRTPRTERIWGLVPGHFERLERGTALGRLGTPEDVARVFVALATSLTHVNGQVMVVDGGQMQKRG